MKFAIGLLISFAVGMGCRYFDVPVGSPAAFPGALIVLAMTAGYSWTNQILNARNRPATTAHLCGGPAGRAVVNGPSREVRPLILREAANAATASITNHSGGV